MRRRHSLGPVHDSGWVGNQSIEVILRHLARMEKRIMALSADLTAVLNDLTSEVNRIGGEIDQLLAVIGTPGIPAADAQAAIDKARGLVAQLKAKSDESDAKVP